MTGILMIVVGVTMAAFDGKLERASLNHIGLVLLFEFVAFMLFMGGIVVALEELK